LRKVMRYRIAGIDKHWDLGRLAVEQIEMSAVPKMEAVLANRPGPTDQSLM
jgi:hypothetical protein